MLRPNEINSKTFNEVGEGVYSAKEVDAFLSEVSSSYEQVFRQNGELVRRLSLLANRLEAYRRQEEKAKEEASADNNEIENESLKNKLEQAKAVAQKMLDEAKLRAAEIIDNANKQADGILIDLNTKVQQQKITLDMLSEQSDAFKKKLLDTYREHLVNIDSIPVEAEKVAIAQTADFKPESVSELVDEVLEEDDSDVLGIADEFIEKLDDHDSFETVEAQAEEPVNKSEEIPSEVEETVEEATSLIEESVEENRDEEVPEQEPVEDLLQAETDVEDTETVSEESTEVVIDTPSDETDEEAVYEPSGFDFEFDGISFDDEDDEEIDDEEDGEEESKPFVVMIDDEAEEEHVSSGLSQVDAIDEVFEPDETVNTENNAVSEDSNRPSFKEMIMAKNRTEESVSDSDSDSDDVFNSNSDEDDSFSEEKFVSLFSDDENE